MLCWVAFLLWIALEIGGKGMHFHCLVPGVIVLGGGWQRTSHAYCLPQIQLVRHLDIYGCSVVLVLHCKLRIIRCIGEELSPFCPPLRTAKFMRLCVSYW